MTPLHWIGNSIRDLLLPLPLWAVRVVFVAVPVLLLVWVLRLPRELTVSPEHPDSQWRNLRWWASAALAVQIVIYAWLG